MTREMLIKPVLAALIVAACGMAPETSPPPAPGPYPYRWFYINATLDSDAAVDTVESVLKLAAEHGLNGMLMFSRFDYITLQNDGWKDRLVRVKQLCDQYGIELVPRCLDIGYNDETILHHDKNLAEGLAVDGAAFEVRDSVAVPLTDPAVRLENGGFETGLLGFSGPAQIGKQVFIERKGAPEGKACLRFENYAALADTILLTQQIDVVPHRLYRLSYRVRVEGVETDDEGFPFLITGWDGRRIEYFEPNFPRDGQWHEVQVGFNSLDYDRIDITILPKGSAIGRFWLDDLRIEEPGMVNLLRRGGTPLTVTGADGTPYEEGRDFATVADSVLDFKFSHPGAALRILPGGRIAEGERLKISFYHGATIYYHQVVACMSEPRIYEIWREQVRVIDSLIAPRKYFLSVDELRMAGTCAACRQRELTPAQLVGDCVQKQVALVREVNPEAEFLIWSDMFDPHHNGDARGHYYLGAGDFSGAWEFLPREIVVACWYHEKRYESLRHFSGLGFRTLACGFYEAKDMERDRTWLEALDVTPGAMGIMYTTWSNNFSLLGEFADLARSHLAPVHE